MTRPSRRFRVNPEAPASTPDDNGPDGIDWDTSTIVPTTPLTVEESDGTPSAFPVDTVKLDAADFTLVDNADGSVSVTTDEPDAAAHIADSSDAHDASAISIVDSGGYYSGTDVEAALQAIGLVLASGTMTNPMTTAGDIIVGGASGTPTRLAAGATSGHVLTSNGSGVAPSWQAAGGGGGGSDLVQVASGAGSVRIPGLVVVDRIPSSPSAYDDEFDTTDTSDPMTGWTTLQTLDSLNMNSDAKSHLHLRKAATGTFEYYGIYKAIPSMPFTVTTKVTDMKFDATFQRSAIILLEAGASNKIFEFGVLWGGATTNFGYGIWANAGTRTTWGGDQNIGNQVIVAPIYLRLVVTSSTSIATQFSRGGLIWQTVQTGINPGFTIANVGLGITSEDNSREADSYFDWIRFS